MAEGLIVRFYLEPVHMVAQSEKEGRPIFEDRIFVETIPIGDNKTIEVHEATEHDKRRFPDEYKRFQDGESDTHAGTPLKEWPYMRPSQIKMLNYLNIFTVEHLAQCGDDALQRMGPGAREIVKQAIAYLDRAKDSASTMKYALENERMKNQISDLQETVRKLVATQPDAPAPKRARRDEQAEATA
jgi:hypothetical protein